MLGSGTSSGVPRIGPDWGRCDPHDPRNRRRRASILVEGGGARVLVDTGPDLREQLLDAGVKTLDAVLWTHDHADHTHGIDELRAIYQHMRVAVRAWGNQATLDALTRRFGYVFEGGQGYPPTVIRELMPDRLRLNQMIVTPFTQRHGDIDSLGFRFEADGAAIAYSTDVSDLPEEAWGALEGLDLWIVDALRRHPHPSHAHLPRTLSWIARAQPKRAWLTHLDPSMDHETVSRELPAGVDPGYDMLTLEIGR